MGSQDATVVSPVDDEVAAEGAPVEAGAEATRSAAHLFQYSQHINAGAGAEGCPHAEDGKCPDAGHFHAWVRLPNGLQQRDIQEKARAAKARRRRAMRDAGDPLTGKPASDAYVILESELDDLMLGDREAVLDRMADQAQMKVFGELVVSLREDDERFENHAQDAEEYQRLAALPPDERPDEEWARLDEAMALFATTLEERANAEKQRELEILRSQPEEFVRETLREARIEGESNETSMLTYYTWLAFVCTFKCCDMATQAKRYFATLEELRNAPPEAVEKIDFAVRDLEGRLARGDAAGN